MIGKTILHYLIIEKLGEGGMGVVYLAKDTRLKRDVAIKFLPRQIAANRDERERFKIEAQAAAALNHPNIATIHAIEEIDDEMFIVMEYIGGKELKDIIKSEIRDPKSAIEYAIQIAEGLQAAHAKGIIHRDIKSSNIMITETGRVKIMDFGLAKIAGSATQLTREHSTLGTAAYMSPEQARGMEVDHRTDIWSFGVVLYEMLTGKMPFQGDYDQAIIYSIVNEEAEPVPETAGALKHIVSKSLAKHPDDRYQTAGEIAAELRAISEGGGRRRTAKQSKLPWMVAGAMAMFIAAVFYLWRPVSDRIENKDKNGVQTIAVLPFLDMSQNKDQEYFSDGLSEELLNVLAKNPKLRVTSRTSAFSFKGTNTDIKTIASKLNVKHILEGSVRKSGNTLRITAQLIDVQTDASLWSETYNGTMEDIFALQDAISGSVAEALKSALLGKAAATEQRKTDPDAYNAYLLGKHYYDLRGRENFEKAAFYFQQALAIDPYYAPAWVELSRTHVAQSDLGYLTVEDGYRKARQEVERALEIDPNYADAYSRLGWIKQSYDWDWSGADTSYRRALALAPGNAAAIGNAARLAATLGRFEEALTLTRRSIELNPLSAGPYNNLGYSAWNAGLLDESLAAYRKVLDLNPQFPATRMRIGLIYLAKGQADSALAEVKQEPEPLWQLFGFALVYHALGRKQEADDKLASFIKQFQNDGAFQIAEIYAYRGEVDKAFEWLERAYDQRDGGCTYLKGDPLLRNIESDPRYAAFLKKMNLPF